MLLALLAAALLPSVSTQYAYHSPSPFGPWAPIQVSTGTLGLTLPPGDIWFGPHCAKQRNSSALNPLACGGNNPSPYFIDHEAATATGFAPGTVVIATTWSANYSYDAEPPRARSSISVGVCKNWSSACDIHPQVPPKNPCKILVLCLRLMLILSVLAVAVPPAAPERVAEFLRYRRLWPPLHADCLGGLGL